MKKNKIDIFGYSICVIGVLLAFGFYKFLPEQIPLHWNLSGEIDSTCSKNFIFLFGFLPLFMYLILGILPLIDPKQDNYKKFKKVYSILKIIMALFMLSFEILTIYASFKPLGVNVTFISMLMEGVLFCVMGNYMPKFKHTYFCGIRTPWTLSSEAVWAKTHRLAGKLWFTCGLFVILTAFFAKGHILLILNMIVVITMLVIPTVYSFIVYKKEP